MDFKPATFPGFRNGADIPVIRGLLGLIGISKNTTNGDQAGWFLSQDPRIAAIDTPLLG